MTTKEDPDYYLATTATIMVPVQVRYHLPTGVVYSFECPTREQVEQAIKDQDAPPMEDGAYRKCDKCSHYNKVYVPTKLEGQS
jgi:hypothetical protein